MRPSLGALLIKAGIASEQDVNEATEEGQATGELLGEWVIRKGLATDELVAKLLAEQWELPYATADELEIEEVATLRITRFLARELGVQPIRYDGDTIVLAIAEPHANLFADVADRIGDASFVVVSRSTLESLIGAPLRRMRGEAANGGETETEDAVESPDTGDGDGEFAMAELDDLPSNEEALELDDPASEESTEVELGFTADSALSSIDAALKETERLTKATGKLIPALRLAREQIAEQQTALAAADEARKRDEEMIRTLESAASAKSELFETLRAQVASLTATLDVQ